MRFPCKIVIVALCVALLFIAGCTPKQQFVWKVYGTWADQDGFLQKGAEFTLSTELPANASPNSSAQEGSLEIDTYLYPYLVSPDTPFTSLTFEANDGSGEYYFLLHGSAWHELSRTAVPMSVWIYPEKEWVVIYWNTPRDHYLVAATDPNADPGMIFELYKQYVQLVTD